MSFIRRIRDNFKNLNLFFKFQIALFIVSTITLSVMGFFAYFQGKQLLTEKSFDLLRNITIHKKKNVEAYFESVKDHIVTLSETPSTIQALLEFSTSFHYIQNKTKKDTLVVNAKGDSLVQKKLTHQAERDSTVIYPKLRRFYDLEFLKAYEYNTVQKVSERKNYIPASQVTAFLQYKYIVANPNPIGFKYHWHTYKEKEGENNKEISSAGYDKIHHKYNNSFTNYVTRFGYEDLFLVDDKANIVYSVAKRVDYATNLKTGVFKNTKLAKLYKKAMNSRSETPVFFQDYSFYPPFYGNPVCFVAIPIQLHKKIGVLIVQISNEPITNILTNNQNWLEEGLENTGETALIGSDYYLRNNTRLLLEDPLNYHKNLLKRNVDTLVVERIKRLNTTTLLRKYKSSSSMNALNGKEGETSSVDVFGTEVLDVYLPVDVLGTRWAMVTEMSGFETTSAVVVFGTNLIIISAILFLFMAFLGAYLAKSLAAPMRKIQREITMLSQGKFPKKTIHIYKDELGKIDQALNTLTSNMKNVAEFAENIGKGNLTYHFDSQGDNDILGNALISMRDSLQKISIEEEERRWTDKGKALLGDIIRKNSDSIANMGKVAIAELVKYLGANQGSFFLMQEQEKGLRAISAYAYGKHKYIHQKITPGIGLVGQTYLEKETLFIQDLPENYSEISSGLGHAKPKCILVVPVKNEESIFGVVEIASFEILTPFKITFAEDIAEMMATTIASINVSEETRKLLKESQKMTEQLRQQEEEMVENFETLRVSQEELQRQQEQIDLLLKGKISMEDLEWSETKQENADNLALSQQNQQIILQQKQRLDEALRHNKIKAETLQKKIRQIGGDG